ncbi:GNAT family N-acetyltransferase [Ectobacillus ponti]|uniref:GNAT family N-acetyltransferase n=1 Tax=Ectobacillus ponti TaxID=2961894 RepID=A0AA42BNW3_9BACI|nr:GNAT family N-acetyltransferase [Ectobacillus ponti]MCP8968425.1 GNAT family N-acetyltransferase [Ectobacillus ponti]
MDDRIRNAVETDIAQVQHVAKASWNETYEGIIPMEIQEAFLRYAYSEDMMKKRMQTSCLLVAERGECIVGFINVSLPDEQKEAELFAIYLLPDHQRVGIGKALLLAAIRHTPDARSLCVNVERDNFKGQRFYAKQGFEVIDEFDDDFDGHILKTTRMVLRLPVE